MTLPAKAQETNQTEEVTKIECTAVPGCRCYAPPQLKAIAGTITDLQKCEVALEERERLIQERFIKFEGQNGVAWWQEPSVVAGGVTISFSVGLVIGILVFNKK